MTSILIIDGNNWFRRRAETDVMGNPLRRCYNEIQQAPYDLVLLVWDGYSSLKARRALYPDYKCKRKPAGDSLYDFQKMFKEVALLSRAITIEVDGFEGDDVIAALVKKYKSTNSVRIESNDADFAQLGVPMAREVFKIEPRWVALYKTLVGDPSDNIKGLPKFGDKAFADLNDNQKATLELVVSGSKLLVGCEDWFSKGCWKWLQEPGNLELLRTYWKIVNFLPIEWKAIENSMKPGSNDIQAAEVIFKEFLS